MAGPIGDITVLQPIYYQLVQLSLVRNAAHTLIDVAPQQPDERQLTISAESRYALMHSPHQEAGNTEYPSLQRSLDNTHEDTARTSLFRFTYLPQINQALQAYAQAAALDRTPIDTISIFV